MSKLDDAPAEWNRVSEQLIGAAMDVHTALGPGLLERLYEQALAHELTLRGVPFRCQVPVRLHYKGIELSGQNLDMVVADLIVVELKSVEYIHEVHKRQLVSYMKSAKLPLGLLINFNVSRLKDGISRHILTHNTPAPPAFLSNPVPPPHPSALSATSAIS